MPRIRTLKPEAFQHRKIGRLSDRAFRLWVAMICHADDHGRLVADIGQLRVLVFGYQASVKEANVASALEEIARTGLVTLYEANGVGYAAFPSWADHQKVDHPTTSRLPAPSVENIREPSRALANVRGGSDLIGSEGSDQKDARESSRADAPSPVQFQIPEPILRALERSERLGRVGRLREDATWWRAQIRAHPRLDLASLVLKAESWLTTHDGKRQKKDLVRFLHNWFANEREESA